MVSSDFGKLDVQRHFSSGVDCAMAGMATPVAAVATLVSPAALRNSRRFMVSSEKSLLFAGHATPHRPHLVSTNGGSLETLPAARGCAICALRDCTVRLPVFVQ